VRYPSIQFAVGQFLVAGTINLSAGLLLEQPISNSDFTIAVVYTALFSVAIGYTTQVWAQRHASPSYTALILSMEAVFALLTGWLFLFESLNLSQVAGCVLIFSGVLMVQLIGTNSE
jgi:drug/metabolite transporter (DMT)-like permease